MRRLLFAGYICVACARSPPEHQPPRCNDLPLFGEVTVLGQVNSPGLVRWHCGMRALDAVREAGGFNALASPRKTRVLREQRRVEAGESLYLLPGDVVTAHALCDGY